MHERQLLQEINPIKIVLFYSGSRAENSITSNGLRFMFAI